MQQWANSINNGEPWAHKAHLPFRFRLLLPFTQQLVLSELLPEISALIRKTGAKLHYPTAQAITLLLSFWVNNGTMGSYVADSGTRRQNKYAISFSSQVYGLVASGNLTDSSNGTDISNLSYWLTPDTNHGDTYKHGGWYLAIGK